MTICDRIHMIATVDINQLPEGTEGDIILSRLSDQNLMDCRRYQYSTGERGLFGFIDFGNLTASRRGHGDGCPRYELEARMYRAGFNVDLSDNILFGVWVSNEELHLADNSAFLFYIEYPTGIFACFLDARDAVSFAEKIMEGTENEQLLQCN